MKIKHLLLAGALAAAVTACSTPVTAPAARSADGAGVNATEEVTTTAVPPDTTVQRDGGFLGSGGGK